MALIEFKNLPDTSTPLTAENLNNNFEYLKSMNDFSTNETVIGKYIDGRPIYRKVYDCGNLPNTTSKNIATNLIFNNSNCIMIKIYGYCYFTNGTQLPLPFPGISATGNIALHIANNNIVITTAGDRSESYGYVIIEYIKMTD